MSPLFFFYPPHPFSLQQRFRLPRLQYCVRYQFGTDQELRGRENETGKVNGECQALEMLM